MENLKIKNSLCAVVVLLLVASCKAPSVLSTKSTITPPETYSSSTDTMNIAKISWKNFFKDKYLQDLIDAAIQNNQELKITLQEIEIAKNDIRLKKGALLPMVGLRAGAGIEKVGRYTSQGAGDATTEIMPGKEFPDPLADFTIGAYANWEVDIWKKLRNSKKAAVNRYLASVEGKNFVLTNLISEVADSYYELLSLDSQLKIVRENVQLQKELL
jgi:multidrug efflux system outer membrane protein